MELCDDAEMAKLVERISASDIDDLAALDEALRQFPKDPRLHFMHGSVLAGRQQHALAHAALSQAVELAPDFHIARYQLGFFELTSGEADLALSTLGPLLRLPADNYLRKFVEGLTHLIRDEFELAIARFHEGIALNTENEPLNNDITLLIGECEKANKGTPPDDSGGEDLSATSILLGQFGNGLN